MLQYTHIWRSWDFSTLYTMISHTDLANRTASIIAALLNKPVIPIWTSVLLHTSVTIHGIFSSSLSGLNFSLMTCVWNFVSPIYQQYFGGYRLCTSLGRPPPVLISIRLYKLLLRSNPIQVTRLMIFPACARFAGNHRQPQAVHFTGTYSIYKNQNGFL